MAEIYRSDIVQVDLDHALLRKHVGAILVTGDKLGNRFGAEIFRDGKPVDVTGCGVTAYFMRPGEDAIVLNGTASGSVAYVDLAQACYSKASSFTLTIKISYVGATTALRVIDGYILLTQTDDLVDPGEVVPTLDDIFAQIAAMEAATNNANAAATNAVNIATEKGDQAIQLAQQEAEKQNVKIATLTEGIARNTAPPIIPTVTGSIVSITDGAARLAAEVISHIAPLQAGSGDPSTNNKRPISGWEKVDAYARGKNIFDTSPTGAQCIGSCYVNASNYDYVISEYENTYAYRVNVQSGGKYIVTTSASEWHTNVRFEDAEQHLVGGLDYPNLKNMTIEIPAQAACMVVSIEKTDMTAHTYQIELGNTATAYESYQDKNLSATLPEPVYGGKLNWTTGKLLSDGVVVDGGSLNWVHWYANMFYAIAPNNDTVRNVLCEVYPKGRELAENGVFTMPTAHTSIYIRDDTLTDGAAGAAELKQKLSGHKIFYQKESPVEYQLTPQQISTLQGINNVWSSTGDTTLSYVADTMLYIDQRIAALLNA